MGGQQVPYYATSSEQLARDVQTLLVRLGIVSRIHTKNFRYRYRGETQDPVGFTVHLIGEDSVQSFSDRILPHVVGRDEDVRRLRERLATMPAGRSSKDTVPVEVRRTVDQERQQAGLTWRELEAEIRCVRS